MGPSQATRRLLNGFALMAAIALTAATTPAAGAAPATGAAPGAPDRACAPGMVRQGPLLHRVARTATPPPPARNVRVTFIGHSTFLLETPGGASVATDWNGLDSPPVPPQAVTMNNRHDTHYTDDIDPGIRLVLRGWDPDGGVARHDVKYKDARIYNVPTNMSVFDGRPTNENSIFVMESQGLCFAHVGHLAEVLGSNHLYAIGRIDVLFLPIDGMYTMSLEEALSVIKQVRPKLVIPMHSFDLGLESEFTAMAQPFFPVKEVPANTILINRRMLPRKTEILYLKNSYGRGFGFGGGFE